MSPTLQTARIEFVESAGAFRPLRPTVQNRIVIDPQDLRKSSPFVVLAEDYMWDLHDDHLHAHRGFETVTFVLEGEITNVDHTGYRSVTPPGAVQWMTAGSGIVHGGRPHGGSNVHLLQLWLNLPSRSRGVPPETREQTREQALQLSAPGVSVTIYGEGGRKPGDPAWSVHPMTITDLRFDGPADYTLELPPGERMFVYVLSGAVEFPGQSLSAEKIAWIAVDEAAQTLPLRATETSRVIAYSGQPIDEPSIAQGPFVMTTREEIKQAYADLNAGRIVA